MDANYINNECAECAICLETLVNTERMSLICSHVFHESCINDWLNGHETCPICRTIQPKTIHNIDDNVEGDEYEEEEEIQPRRGGLLELLSLGAQDLYLGSH